MNVMIVGGGGREHAIALAVSKNPSVDKLYALPGNAGISECAECVGIKSTDIDAIVAFAESHSIDFAIVAQDDPLALGCVDRLHAINVKCFGPNAAAAEIESSKIFAKRLMKKYSIPTAAFEVFTSFDDALAYVENAKYPLVIKADGLALGKGVIIAEDKATAENALKLMMRDGGFGLSGERVVIEEFLTGVEVSVLAFTDGTTIKPMVSSMDHKRALDNDMGDNTGGMGTIAPNPYYTDEIADSCMKDIFLPTINAMRAEGRPFKGCLYFGLMLTSDGAKVIEYNCRFGDPEAQVVLPLLKTDLLDVMLAVEDGALDKIEVEFDAAACCCVMVASGGYPHAYEKGKAIDLGNAKEFATLYHSGTCLKDGVLLTNGGRVMGASAVAESLPKAIEKAYTAANEIQFENKHMRFDIGRRAIEVLKNGK